MATKKKAAAKKAVTKKAVTKKAAAKPAAPAKKPLAAIKEAFNKTQLIQTISERTTLAKKDVKGVLDELGAVIGAHVSKKGAQTFTMPGLFKVKVINKPATKARKGINPFTGQEQMFKAKPARNVVKVLPLKGLKDAAK